MNMRQRLRKLLRTRVTRLIPNAGLVSGSSLLVAARTAEGALSKTRAELRKLDLPCGNVGIMPENPQRVDAMLTHQLRSRAVAQSMVPGLRITERAPGKSREVDRMREDSRPGRVFPSGDGTIVKSLNAAYPARPNHPDPEAGQRFSPPPKGINERRQTIQLPGGGDLSAGVWCSPFCSEV